MTKSEYRERFYKMHPIGSRSEIKKNMGLEATRYSYCVGAYNLGRGEVRIYYTSDGIIDPFKTYTDSYLQIYMKEHPMGGYDEEHTSSRISKRSRGGSRPSYGRERIRDREDDDISAILRSEQYQRTIRHMIDQGGGLEDMPHYSLSTRIKEAVKGFFRDLLDDLFH